MRYGAIKPYDIANGPGVRVSLFVSGCRHHCPGCFQPETWAFDYGDEFTEDTMNEILNALEPQEIQGLSLLGGDPLEPENEKELIPLVKAAKERFPEKDIWLYTGCIYEEVKDRPILEYIDVLVDGPFIESQKDLMLEFRGSKNQRIIKLKEDTK